MSVRACVLTCARARVCVRVCVCAHVRVRVRVHVRACAWAYMPTGGGQLRASACIDRYQLASLIGGDGLSTALVGAETNPYNNPYILVRSPAATAAYNTTWAAKQRGKAAGRRLGKGTWIVQPLGMRMTRISVPTTRISDR